MLEFQRYGNNAVDAQLVGFGNIDFGNLREIILQCPSLDTIKNVLRTGKNIRKLRLETYDSHNGVIAPSAAELKSVIPDIFKCKSLQYFAIQAEITTFESVLQGIEIGLFKTNEIQREKFKINIEMFTTSERVSVDSEALMLNLQRIVHALNEKIFSKKMKQYMCIIDLSCMSLGSNDYDYGDKLHEEFNKISANAVVKHDGLYFVIANTGLDMEEWSEHWLVDDIYTV